MIRSVALILALLAAPAAAQCAYDYGARRCYNSAAPSTPGPTLQKSGSCVEISLSENVGADLYFYLWYQGAKEDWLFGDNTSCNGANTVLLGSLNGPGPTFLADGVEVYRLPLTFDAYTAYTLAPPLGAVRPPFTSVSNFTNGTLPALQIHWKLGTLPPELRAALVGKTFHFVGVTYDDDGDIRSISNGQRIPIVP